MSDVTIPFALGDVPERAKRDGCGCPAWVKQCAHFGEAVAVLTDASKAPICEGVENGWRRGWTVGILPYGWDAVCDCPQPHPAYWGVGRPYLKLFTNHAAALAAFFDAERRLLGGVRGAL